MTNRRMVFAILIGALAGTLFIDGGTSNAQDPASAKPPNVAASADDPVRLNSENLPNPVRVHPKVISGGLPGGDRAFAELAQRGVQTIISVDGAKPDVEAAKKYGLRYVHLPHGYDGIPQHRVEELAKAVRDLDGSIYIHCHHGKHRSPAAASVACVAAGLIPSSKALAVLELAGTSPTYRGLFQSARNAHVLDPQLLDQLEVQFQANVDVPPIAEAMAALGHTHDHLKQIAEAGWKTPEDHPDLHPAHEALLLREHFTELLRTKEVQQQPADFRELLRDSEQAAERLEAALTRWETAPSNASIPHSLSPLEKRISVNCTECHEKYRNVKRNPASN